MTRVYLVLNRGGHTRSNHKGRFEMARRSLPKIDHLSAAELQTLIKRAEQRLAAKRDEAKAEFLAKMRKEAKALGLSLDDIVRPAKPARRKRADAGVKLKPKYIGPNGETYGGRGPTPAWLKKLEAKGHKREKYLAK